MPEVLVVPDALDSLPPPFAYAWTNGRPDAGRVRPAAESDVATAPQLERTLRELQSGTHLVLFDLRGLESIDSASVHAIVNASIRARKAGQRLVLVHGSPNADRTFAPAWISDRVEIGDVEPQEDRRADS